MTESIPKMSGEYKIEKIAKTQQQYHPDFGQIPNPGPIPVLTQVIFPISKYFFFNLSVIGRL